MRLSDYVQEHNTKSLFYMDTETHAITKALPVPPFVCLQYAVDNNPPTILGGTQDAKGAAKDLFLSKLADDNSIIVAHNGFYDYSVMLGLHDYFKPGAIAPDAWITKVLDKALSGGIRDTLPMAKLNAIEFDWLTWDRKTHEKPKFNLAWLVKRFVGDIMAGKDKENEKRVQMTYHLVDGLPVEKWGQDHTDYALGDITHLRNLYKRLVLNTYPDESFQTAVYWVFRLMEVWGIHTSKAHVEDLKSKVKPRIEAATNQLVDMGFMRPGEWKTNTEKLEAFIRKLCEAKGIEPKMTPGGKVSTAAAFLKSLDCPALFDKRQWQEQGNPTRDMALIRSTVETWYSSRGLEVPKVEKKANPYLEDDDDDFYGGEEDDVVEEPNISTARDALAATDDPGLLLLADIGKYKTLESTFIPVMELGYLYPIHPYWNGLVNTGRPSCVNPNLLNQPRELGRDEPGVREAYQARPGYAYLDPDYTQAELCSLAQICIDKFGYSRMGEVIRSGKDIHVWFAAMICGEAYSGVADGCSKKIKKYTDLRQLAKAANFGFPGGLGIKKFIKWARKTYNVVITEAQAKVLKADWLVAFPEIRDYFNWVNDQIKRGGRKFFTYVQHRSNRKRGGVGFCNGCNTGFQGLTADGAKNALIRIFRACHDPSNPLYGSRIVAFIYDEILVETPLERLNEASKELVRLMVEGMNVYTPDVGASVTIEAMYNWSKKAKAVYDNNGHLVPFDDYNKPAKHTG